MAEAEPEVPVTNDSEESPVPVSADEVVVSEKTDADEGWVSIV